MRICLKLDKVKRQQGGEILEDAGQGAWEVLKIGPFSWTSYAYRPLLQACVPDLWATFPK